MSTPQISSTKVTKSIKKNTLILSEYYNFITNSLCIYGLKGEKTDEERFPGAVNTYTIEVMTQDGKALQMATSHYLGQSFSKAFDIKFLGRENIEQTAFTASICPL